VLKQNQTGKKFFLAQVSHQGKFHGNANQYRTDKQNQV